MISLSPRASSLRRIASSLVLFAISTSARSACCCTNPLDRPRIIGLLAIPGIESEPRIDLPIAVFSAARSRWPIGRLHLDPRWIEQVDGYANYDVSVEVDGVKECLPELEFTEDEPAAIVVGRANHRFEILVRYGTVWVDVLPAMRFVAVPELLRGQTLYVRTNAKGRARRAPGGRRVADIVDWPAARLLNSVRSGSSWWLHVRRMIDPMASSDDLASRQPTAWIRFHDSADIATIWFYSRD